MGVDLKPILPSFPIKVSDLSDKVVAVDAFNTIYQFLSTIRGYTGEPLTNNRGEITSHLSGLFYRNVNFLAENIKLVYIFDGKPHQLKYHEIERRRQVKTQAFEKYQQALSEGKLEDAKKYSQATSAITDKIVQDSKKILNLLGIQYIQAASEGEATAAKLTQKEIAFVCASQDYDSLLFGAKRLVRNLTISGKRKLPNRNMYINVEPEIILLDDVIKATKLTQEQLIDVGILVGTDFNPGGFPAIGPKTALKLIIENGRLENIEKIKPMLEQIPYQEIREIFLNTVENDGGLNGLKLKFDNPDNDKIIKFLCDEMSFSQERVKNALEKLEKVKQKKNQSLEKWFG